MFRIAICDDEPVFTEQLETLVKIYLTRRELAGEVVMFSSGEAVLAAAPDFQILLMDLRLPGKNGIQIARQLRHRQKTCQIIFISSFQQYVFESFDVDPIHYLLKPIDPKKLFEALDKAVKRSKQDDNQSVLIEKGAAAQVIFLRDILYCEAINHKIIIHTMEAPWEYFGTLDSLLQKLDQRFFRCHRSYIVNLEFVISKEQDSATVVGGGQVLVSRRKRQEFTRKLLECFKEEVL